MANYIVTILGILVSALVFCSVAQVDEPVYYVINDMDPNPAADTQPRKPPPIKPYHPSQEPQHIDPPGGQHLIADPSKHEEFQIVDAFIRSLENGLLKNAVLLSVTKQTVNGFKYRAIYALDKETHRVVVYTPYMERKPELMAWNQIVSPIDQTIVKSMIKQSEPAEQKAPPPKEAEQSKVEVKPEPPKSEKPNGSDSL